jgi:hypothetical protein
MNVDSIAPMKCYVSKSFIVENTHTTKERDYRKNDERVEYAQHFYV